MDKTKILLIDDHPLILEGYINVLNSSDSRDYLISTSNDLADARKNLFNASVPYDLICLDMNMPAEESLDLYSGEDLGILIRKNFPELKLIIMTMHDDNFRLFNILQNINPEGFLIKKDIKPIHLRTAFEEVLVGNTFYSHTVANLLRKQVQNDMLLDGNDRKILYYLSKGFKTKNLPEKIPLSLAAIEKRKRLMKIAFHTEVNSDLALLNRAKDLGFL